MIAIAEYVADQTGKVCGSMGRRMRIAALSLFSVAFLMQGAEAQDSYPIGPGDVLSISFLSNPSFNREARVGIDGSIFVPFIGEVAVAGRTINEVRGDIPVLMTGAVFRERINGEELLVTLLPEEVVVDVVNYRPIYVDGAVEAPGEVRFEIGMTLRQAVAAAQGIQTPLAASSGGSVRVQDHPQVLMAELVGVLAEMAVHRAFLSEDGVIDTSELEDLDAPADLLGSAVEMAKNRVVTTQELLDEEAAFLARSVTEAEARVVAALRHEEVLSEIVQAEEAEVNRVQDLVGRGVIRSDRLTEARRLYLQAVERLSNVQARRLTAEDDWRELVLQSNQTIREKSLLDQSRLQELSQRASQLRVQIDLSSASLTEVESDSIIEGAPRISIFRHVGGQVQQLNGSADTRLMPGDVINIWFEK